MGFNCIRCYYGYDVVLKNLLLAAVRRCTQTTDFGCFVLWSSSSWVAPMGHLQSPQLRAQLMRSASACSDGWPPLGSVVQLCSAPLAASIPSVGILGRSLKSGRPVGQRRSRSLPPACSLQCASLYCVRQACARRHGIIGSPSCTASGPSCTATPSAGALLPVARSPM